MKKLLTALLSLTMALTAGYCADFNVSVLADDSAYANTSKLFDKIDNWYSNWLPGVSFNSDEANVTISTNDTYLITKNEYLNDSFKFRVSSELINTNFKIGIRVQDKQQSFTWSGNDSYAFAFILLDNGEQYVRIEKRTEDTYNPQYTDSGTIKWPAIVVGDDGNWISGNVSAQKIKEGSILEVQAINESDGVRLLLKADGIEIINWLDKGSDAITAAGNFGVISSWYETPRQITFASVPAENMIEGIKDMNDANGWIYDTGNDIKVKIDGDTVSTVDRYEYKATYTKSPFSKDSIAFSLSVLKNDKNIIFGVRDQNTSDYNNYWNSKGYFLYFSSYDESWNKVNTVTLKKGNGLGTGNNVTLASTSYDVIESTVNPSYPLYVEISAVNNDDNTVTVELKINNNTILTYLDSDNPILDYGYFSMGGNWSEYSVTDQTQASLTAGGYVDMKAALGNYQNFMCSYFNGVKFINNSATFKGLFLQTAPKYSYENTKVKLFMDSDGKDAALVVGLRSSGGMKHIDTSGMYGYYFTIDTSAEHPYIFIRKSIDGSVYDLAAQTQNTEIINAVKDGAVFEFSAINEGNSVRISLSVSGQEIFDYSDQTNPILSKGSISFIDYSGNPLTISDATVNPIIINTPSSYQVFQRDSDGYANIEIKGTVCLEDNQKAFITVLQDDSIISSTEINTLNNEFLIKKTLATGIYQIKIDIKSGETVISSYLLNEVSVGDIWIAAGQSNMHGFGIKQPGYTVQNSEKGVYQVSSYFTGTYGWERLRDVGFDYRTNRTSPATRFAHILYQETGVPIGIIQSAVGGSAIESWIPENAGGNNILYNNMLSSMSEKKASGVIWYQGESNSYAANTDYENKFKSFVSNLEADFGTGIPVITAQLNQVADAGYTQWLDVKEIQRQMPHQLSNVAVIVTNDLPMSDGIHNSAQSTLTVAKRMADYALNMKYGIKVENYKAPDLKTAIFKGNKILLQFDNAERLSKYSESVEITDFNIDGATIKNVNIKGASSVEITVDALPQNVIVSSINGAGIDINNPIIPTLYDEISGLPALSFKVAAKELKTGDCNIDDNVNIKDLVRLKKISSGLVDDTIGSDINQDGKTNSVDIVDLQKMLLEK